MCLIAAHADPSVQFCPQRVGVIAHFTCVTNLQESAKKYIDILHEPSSASLIIISFTDTSKNSCALSMLKEMFIARNIKIHISAVRVSFPLLLLPCN